MCLPPAQMERVDQEVGACRDLSELRGRRATGLEPLVPLAATGLSAMSVGSLSRVDLSLWQGVRNGSIPSA